METTYTVGDWRIEPGREDEFVEAWSDLARWTVTDVPGTTVARLLGDPVDPQRFLSFAPWDDREAVTAWQAMPGFHERLANARACAESVEVRVLSVVRRIG